MIRNVRNRIEWSLRSKILFYRLWAMILYFMGPLYNIAMYGFNCYLTFSKSEKTLGNSNEWNLKLFASVRLSPTEFFFMPSQLMPSPTGVILIHIFQWPRTWLILTHCWEDNIIMFLGLRIMFNRGYFFWTVLKS